MAKRIADFQSLADYRREFLRVSQKDIGKLIGREQSWVSQIEGGHLPLPKQWKVFAEAYKLDEEEFVRLVKGSSGVPQLENLPIPRDERGALQSFSYSSEPITGTKAVLGWIGAAAGNSREVERAEDPIFVYEKLPPDHRYFKIHGDSMINTLQDGDIVIVKELGEKGLLLPALKPSQPKTPVSDVKTKIPSYSIALLSIDYGGLTVKRIKYATKPNNNWHLMLIADNPYIDDYPYPVPRNEEVIFWALVVGIAKRRKEK